MGRPLTQVTLSPVAIDNSAGSKRRAPVVRTVHVAARLATGPTAGVPAAGHAGIGLANAANGERVHRAGAGRLHRSPSRPLGCNPPYGLHGLRQGSSTGGAD
jgi:hypothetical protein